MILWRIFRPSLGRLLILLPLLSLALRIGRVEALSLSASLVTIGFPFNSGILGIYRGPCGPGSICTRLWIEALRLPGLVGNILLAYLLACLLWLVYKTFIKPVKADGR